MPTRLEIVAEARKWLGTPFHHQGRVLGRGVDCAGVVIQVAKALSLSDFDTTNYGMQPNGDEMERILVEHMDRVTLDDRQQGDVVHFAFDGDPQHLAILTEKDAMLHSYALQPRKVIEHRMDETWMSRIRGVYKYRGIA